jgi:hypothetical protein
MSRDALASYLNDHIAGSVAGIELVEHLVETAADGPTRAFFEELRGELVSDQQALRRILEALDTRESGLRKAGAWLTEKAARLKLQLEGSARGSLHELEALEALALGITGKLALWRALSAADGIDVLHGVDLEDLAQRASSQHARVEARRLQVAHALFAPMTHPG